MSAVRTALLTACLAVPFSARAEDVPMPLPAIPDAVYKGVVGKALDAVPMDTDQRIALQRANAVVSNTLTGRSLAVWAGLTNPILLIGGLAWGLFSASNIKASNLKPAPATAVVETGPLDWKPGTGVVLLEHRHLPLPQDQW